MARLHEQKGRYFTFINRLSLLFSEGITNGEFLNKGSGMMAVAYE